MPHLHRPTLPTRASAFALLSLWACGSAFANEGTPAAPSGGDEIQAVHAIWLSQNVPFSYRGERTSYTCEMFKEKVRAILISVGVHASLIVELGCDSALPVPQQTGRRPTPGLIAGEVESTPIGPTHISGTSSRIVTRIALAAPAVADSKNIRAATTFDAQQHLVAKMRSETLPTPSTIPVFPAVWTNVQLSGKNNPWLEADDCELLRQLSQQVLPTLGIKVTRKVICSGAKLAKPALHVEALMPIYAAPTTR
jgi:hypothetical protein